MEYKLRSITQSSILSDQEFIFTKKLVLSPSGKLLAAVSNREVKVYEVEKYILKHSIVCESIESVIFAVDESYLLVNCITVVKNYSIT